MILLGCKKSEKIQISFHFLIVDINYFTIRYAARNHSNIVINISNVKKLQGMKTNQPTVGKDDDFFLRLKHIDTKIKHINDFTSSKKPAIFKSV